MAGLSNSTLSVLSTSYYDDYSEDKRFHRILFRPSVAVQARELTQLQTILQNQISKFGDHVFKDGSIVDGVALTYYPNVHYMSLSDNFDTNTSLTVLDLDKQTTIVTNSTDSNNAVRAIIKIAKQGYITQRPNTNRIYLDYIVTGTDEGDNDVNEFSEGDTLYFYNSSQSKFGELIANNLIDTIVTLSTNGSFTASGYTYCIGASDGIIYQKGFFSKVEPQVITINDYSTNVNGYVVGFDTTESIIKETQDTSLYDNALGSSNANAPGAHRLKLSPALVAKHKSDTSNTNFFAIVEFDGSEPTQQKDEAEYDVLGEQLARRTYEESGDYAVKPFRIETRETSNTSTFNYEISSGVAYVRGKRRETLNTSRVEVPRAITTEVAQNVRITADFGNYVICDEFLGAFDYETLSEISLYDQPQNAISEYEGITSSPSGSEIGKANVKAVLFESGEKGNPTALYNVYLFNIRMNSGKSFSEVKSLYTNGTFGKAKADIVLENNKAVLKDTSFARLIYPLGINAPKRLTDSLGTNDTDFNYMQITTSSIAANGVSVVSIDTPAAGGSERLASSAGSSLSAGSLDQYNIYMAANAYTANLTGTIAYSNDSVLIAGTSTLFQSELSVNSSIRIYDGSSHHIRRVTGIDSNTTMYIDSVISTANSTANFQEYFVTGTPLPINSVYINSNTQFTAYLGKTLDSGSNTVYASYPVNRNLAVPASKEINKNVLVKIDCSNNVNGTTGPFNLGLTDVLKINSIYVGTTYANTNPDRSNWFILDSGQTDEIYDHSKLILKPQYRNSITSSSRILVNIDVFTANTAAGIGFFSIDSYPIDDANTANTNAIQTSNIPFYDNLDLRAAIDFRPRRYNTANVTTSAASSTVNPDTSNTSFNVPGTGQHLPQPFSTFNADVEYYLPRYDSINMDNNGVFVVSQGVPSLDPKMPFVEGDQSKIAEAYVPPYPSLTQREGAAIGSTNIIKINIKTNRRYTMKDIGALEERVKRMEYYMVLSALEQSTKDLTIPDADGLDRFKNGIFADPFNSHKIGNASDIEYRVSVDSREGIMRPQFDSHYVDFKFNSDSSNNVTKAGSLILLNHTHEAYINQRYATKYRNATESVWDWNGKLELYPSHDFAPDITQAPANQVNLDLSEPWQQLAQSPFGTLFGEWEEISETTTRVRQQEFWTITDTTTITTISEQDITQMVVDTTTNTIDLGSYIQDINISPFMRTRLVAFVSYNNKPRTTLHAFFDDINVDVHCAPGVLSGITDVEEGKEDRIVTRQGNFGDALVTDDNGFICGIFRIPAETFRVGDRLFKLLNVSDLITGTDAIITNSFGLYTAENIAVTRGSTTINVTNPSISSETSRRSRTDVVSFTTINDDPLAQSFTIANLPQTVTGIFLTQVGIYFQSKDPDVGVSVYLLEMNANQPELSKTLAVAHLNSSDITVSDDASEETVFTFDQPAYLLSGTDYAFMIAPDGNSPEYNVWVGETGGYDIASGEQVFSNPYSGVLFVSANAKTWTAIQKEDLKYKLYRAKFTSSSGYAVFNNEDDEYLTIDGFTRANTSIGLNVGDVVYTVNSTSNSALTGNSDPFGIIQYIDEAEGKIYLDSSTNGGFSANTNPHIRVYAVSDISNTALISNTNLVAYGNVISVDSLKYHAAAPKIQVMAPSRTYFSNKFKGTSTADVTDSEYFTIRYGTEYQFVDVERHAMSKSLEVADLYSAKSSIHRIDMSTDTDYSSPAISLKKKASLFIENIINDTNTNEYTRYGDSVAKYVSRVVTLADGQDAEDLKVYLGAYRPVDTDIKVYAKFKNGSDLEEFNNKVWTELQYDNGSDMVYSSSTNTSDYREYEFSVRSTPLSYITIDSNTSAITIGEEATQGANTGNVLYVDNTYVTVAMTNGLLNPGAIEFGIAGSATVSSSNTISAFANSTVSTYDPLVGTVNIANNSNVIEGTGTSFESDFEIGSTIRIVSGNYFAIRTVTDISNNTVLTVDNGLQAANAAALYYIFAQDGNDGVVEYADASGARFIGYKQFALKIVMLSSNPVRVPRLDDLRAIALQM